MADQTAKPERKYSLIVSVRVLSVTAEQAQKIEDAIRDIVDDYPGGAVDATKSAERPTA